MSATILPPAWGPHSALLFPTTPCRFFGELPFHTDADVLALHFGQRDLLSLEEGGLLRRWDPESGRLLSWHALEQDATLWQFSPNGHILAAADGDLTLWDVAAALRRSLIPQDAWVTAIAFGPDPDIIASGHDDGMIRIWDMSDGQLILRLRGHQRPVSALAFSPDGRRLVSAGEEKLMLLWNTCTGEIEGLLGGHTDRIPKVAWHPDGNRLFSAGWDTTARVWDVRTCEPIILLNSHASQVVTMAVSADGSLLACADSANAVHVWDVDKNETIQILNEAEAEIRWLAFRPDGLRLAAGGADRVIHVWEPRSGKCTGGRVAPWGVGADVSISSDGKRLARIHGEWLQLWDALASRLLFERKTGALMHSVAFSPDGQVLATAGDRLRFWDARTAEPLYELEGPAEAQTMVAFAPEGHLLASAGPDTADVWLWDANAGQPSLLIPAAVPSANVQALAFHPRRSLIAVAAFDWFQTGGEDGGVALWDVRARLRQHLFPGGALAVAFDPGGHHLAVTSLDQTIRVFDLYSHELVAELQGHADAVRCLAYSPDGIRLVSGSDDRTVRLWEVASGSSKGIAALPTQAKSLCFSPDGRRIFTANANGSCCQIDAHGLQDPVSHPTVW